MLIFNLFLNPISIVINIPNLLDSSPLDMLHTEIAWLRNSKRTVLLKASNPKNILLCSLRLINSHHFSVTTVGWTTLITKLTFIFWRALLSINTKNYRLTTMNPSCKMVVTTIRQRGSAD